MERRVERRAGRQQVGGIEVLSGLEYPARVAHADLHLTAQDEHPLRIRRAMPLAAKADRAVAQLVARRGQDLRQHRLRVAFSKRDLLFAVPGAAVAIGEADGFGQILRARYWSAACGLGAMRWLGRLGEGWRPLWLARNGRGGAG